MSLNVELIIEFVFNMLLNHGRITKILCTVYVEVLLDAFVVSSNELTNTGSMIFRGKHKQHFELPKRIVLFRRSNNFNNI